MIFSAPKLFFAYGLGNSLSFPLWAGCTAILLEDRPTAASTLAMIDAGGEILGTYRKSHIPDGPGYEEKYYFRPGNDGFKVWDVAGTRIGVGICWDQWYPEAARVMALMGAELLFYPTAIGSEPYDADLDTSRMWRRAMQGHAVSNCMPVIAANRIGAAVIIAGLLLASALMARVNDAIAVLGFTVASVLGLYMLWKILRTPGSL